MSAGDSSMMYKKEELARENKSYCKTGQQQGDLIQAGIVTVALRCPKEGSLQQALAMTGHAVVWGAWLVLCC